VLEKSTTTRTDVQVRQPAGFVGLACALQALPDRHRVSGALLAVLNLVEDRLVDRAVPLD
jgi:hypothetical protein